MTKLQIDLDEWIKSLGVAPLVSAYYDIENERKVDEWRELLADGCVQYAAFDGNEPETVSLSDRIEYTLDQCQMFCTVRWSRNVGSNMAVAEIGVDTTFNDGEKMELTAVVKYEYDGEHKLTKATAFYLEPGIVAKFRDRVLHPAAH